MLTVEAFAARAVGVPFLDRGRDYAGWDCWGCLRCGIRDVLGVDIPSYAAHYRTARDQRRIAALMERDRPALWTEVAAPAPMDGILLRIDGRPTHVGLVIDGRRFLHVERGIDTVLEDFGGVQWRERVLGFYRLRAVDAESPQAAIAS